MIDSCILQITGEDAFPSIESFEELGLRKILLENIGRVGYTTPTPIQRHASPQLINGRDVMACAQTGSGKTVKNFVN